MSWRCARTGPGAVTRLAAAAAALAVLGGALAGCDALGKLGASAKYPAATTFTIKTRVTSLVIDGGSGSISVTGGPGAVTSVSQQESYSTTPPVIRRVLRGTTLTLSYSCPAELSCGVSYTISLPAAAAVTVSTGAGGITLSSLSGPVTARADAGLITADSLSSAMASFRSSAGGVIAAFAVPPRSVSASTDVGPITVTVPGSAAYRISTHTYVGTSSVTVRSSTTSPYAISASSDLGSISINSA